ncbi:MAG: glycosyltransferase family 4 protein [Deltaproteobacteria bacterium]|nr:glycosyltransferase family 4 protein [Deltaproteobacteria bacterium]
MRVWQCTGLNVTGVGGVEKHIAEVSAGLRRLKHEVHIGPELPENWIFSESQERLIVHTHGDFWPNPIKFRKHRKALCWIHVCHGTSLGRVVACREFLSISGWRGSITDFLPTRFADAAIAVGQNALEEARRYFKLKLPAAVIRNGADPTVFAPLKQIHLKPNLIYVGRSSDRVKNVPAMLEACAAVYAVQPSLQLQSAPGIDYDHEIYPFVKNLGPLGAPALAEALAKCRTLLLCSLYEGDPIVLHEAQAMGLPVVVSDIPQIRSTLKNYTNALFVNPRNVDSIAFGIKSALFGLAPSPLPIIRDWTQVAREFTAFYETVFKASK